MTADKTKPAGAGPAAGHLVAGRYFLTAQFPTDMADIVGWHAKDTALERPVSVLLLTGPLAQAGADAARRAAAVTDSRLLKIIDVGADGNHQYVVTEPVAGSTLAELVSDMPFDSGTARALVGEAALALDAADRRGLHHAALRPDAVRVTNGRVVVTGLGLDADLGAVSAADADGERHDAQALAALAYYAVTGKWPLPESNASWRHASAVAPPAAQRDSSGAITPLIELVPDADPALVRLTELAFGRDPSPLRSPHNVVTALQPWQPLVVAPSAAAAAPKGASRSVARVSALAKASAQRPATGRIRTVAAAAGVFAAGAAGAARLAPPPVSLPPSIPPAVGRPTVVSPVADTNVLTGPPTRRQSRRARERRRGIRATPIVLGLALTGMAASGAWAARSVIEPFHAPLIITGDIADPSEIDGVPAAEGDAVETRPTVARAASVDPFGDGERVENSPAAVDGDPSTFWYTYTYASADFGGLKPGVGFLLELEQPAEVRSITIYTNGRGGALEVRTGDEANPSGGEILARGQFDIETTLEFSHAVELDQLTLWITELPKQPDGRYRLELREVILH